MAAISAKQQFSFLAMAFFSLPIWCKVVESLRLIPPSTMSRMHDEWMAKYNRVYSSDVEKKMRLEMFARNVKYVDELNAAGNKSYKVSIHNHVADHTEEEIQRRYDRHNPRLVQDHMFQKSFRYEHAMNIPDSMDWRKKGVLTPVKNQEPHGARCESCWAFASISTIEAVNKLKTGKLVSLSEQELVDCTDDKGGCLGGYPEHAFEYVKKYGVTVENEYPYLAHTSKCKKKKNENVDPSASNVVHISGFEQMPHEEGEQGLLKAVASQPVVVSVKLGQEFQFYKSGIFDGECGATLNHVVVAVGYGVDDDGTKYWILRNSWGDGWGEDGYMRMLRGSGRSSGVCGVGIDVSYPIA